MPETNIAKDALEESSYFVNAEPLVDIRGLSSPKVCNLLNQLVARMDPSEYYLEIGTFRGLTLVSAALNNAGKTCVGCDKFRFWGQFTGWGFLAKRALNRAGSAKITFHHMPSERLFREKRVPAPVGVFFYDGDHTYQGTKHHVVVAEPLLSTKSVLVMDDWNDPAIREGTYDGLREAKLEVLWETALEGENLKTEGWWNGLAAFYLERKDGGAS